MFGTLRSRLAGATLVAGCLITAFVAAVSAAPAAAVQDNILQRELDSLVSSKGGPPGAIVVLDRGGDRRIYRSGFAAVDPRRPSPDDHMRIASVAKAFSGAVALRLVDKGSLGLDDTIARRLPKLPAAWGAVTLRELLQHTSGLPDFSASDAFLKLVRADPRRRFDSRRLLSFVASEPLLFKPGTRYQYSNSDNIAVALMAEAVTGRAYEDLLRSLVYTPLGLHGTSLPTGFELPKPYMHGYDVPLTGAPEDVSTVLGASGAWASGGIVSTPNDLDTFIKAVRGPRAHLPIDPQAAAERRRRRLRAPRPRRQRGGPGDLPVHDPLRRGLRPHRQHPGLHAARGRDRGRQPLDDVLGQRDAHPEDRPGAVRHDARDWGRLRLRAAAPVTRLSA